MHIKLYEAFLWSSLTISSLLVGSFIWTGAAPFGFQEVSASSARWLGESERRWVSIRFPAASAPIRTTTRFIGQADIRLLDGRHRFE